MKIQINGVDWEIIELPREELLKKYSELSNTGEINFLFGYASYVTNTIYLNEEVIDKEHTLYHELVHAYLNSFGLQSDNYNEEDICNVASRSSKLINEIIEEYFESR